MARKPKEPAPSRKPMNKIGALWLKKGKNGTFMSGVIDIDDDNSISVLVFKNGFKEQPKHPDYVIYEPDTEETATNRADAQKKFQAADDDVPF